MVYRESINARGMLAEAFKSGAAILLCGHY